MQVQPVGSEMNAVDLFKTAAVIGAGVATGVGGVYVVQQHGLPFAWKQTKRGIGWLLDKLGVDKDEAQAPIVVRLSDADMARIKAEATAVAAAAAAAKANTK